VPLKRQYSFSGLHSVTSQKIVLVIVTAVRTLNSKSFLSTLPALSEVKPFQENWRMGHIFTFVAYTCFSNAICGMHYRQILPDISLISDVMLRKYSGLATIYC
jgi:hypothetical protein